MTHQNPPFAPDAAPAPAPFGTATLLIGAIAVGAGIGLTSPATGARLSNSLDLILLTMIHLLFFELRFEAIVKAFRRFRFLAVAWSANFLLVPALGYVIASLFFTGQPLLFAGLMIYFLAPCTDWFLGFTRMARGDTELGAVLIPVNMITQLLLFPVWLWLFAKGTGAVDYAAMPELLSQWFLLPLITAQAVRFAVEHFTPKHISARLFDWASACIPLVLAALITVLFAANIGVLNAHRETFLPVVFAVLLFFLGTFAIGESLSRIFGLGRPQQTVLAMTMTARNAPLMLALTAAALPGQPLIMAVIVLGMLIEIPLLTALKQIMLWRSETGK